MMNKSLTMINDPNKWPTWPRLPLRRIGSALLETGNLGYLLELRGGVQPTVYIGNIHDRSLPTDSEHFDSFRDLLKHWEID
jgi:hypothetical protein